jgi:hypothetical protein
MPLINNHNLRRKHGIASAQRFLATERKSGKDGNAVQEI